MCCKSWLRAKREYGTGVNVSMIGFTGIAGGWRSVNIWSMFLSTLRCSPETRTILVCVKPSHLCGGAGVHPIRGLETRRTRTLAMR